MRNITPLPLHPEYRREYVSGSLVSYDTDTCFHDQVCLLQHKGFAGSPLHGKGGTGMKRWMFAVLTLVLIAVLSGCGFVAEGPFGWAYTNSKMPIAIGSAKSVSKVGKSCIHSFFGMTSIGDASIEAAMRSAGITEIFAVDTENLSIFGTYTRVCTVVSGE
jgi:TRL-like protein family